MHNAPAHIARAYLVQQAVSPSRRDAELRNMRHGMQENGAPVVGIGLSVQFDSGPGSKFVVSSITPGEAAARDGSIGLSLPRLNDCISAAS